MIVDFQGLRWNFTAIYGSHNVHARAGLWKSMSDISFEVNDPWLLVGDFNAVLFAHERSSGCLG